MKRIFNLIVISLFAFYANALSYYYSTISTPNGSSIEVIYFTETTAEKSALNTESQNYINSNYSNATIIGEATNTYNCHGYAWSKSEGGATCWINQYTSTGAANLSKYWTDGSYTATTSSLATKIFYPEGDHSAIVNSSYPGKYVSKWGAYHLVVHDPTDGPYTNMSNRNYYIRSSIPSEPTFQSGTLSCYPNQSILDTNIDYTFSNTTYTNTSYTYEWTVTTSKEDDDAVEKGLATISVNSPKTSAKISFLKTGIFFVYLRVYTSSGTLIGEFSCEVITEE